MRTPTTLTTLLGGKEEWLEEPTVAEAVNPDLPRPSALRVESSQQLKERPNSTKRAMRVAERGAPSGATAEVVSSMASAEAENSEVKEEVVNSEVSAAVENSAVGNSEAIVVAAEAAAVETSLGLSTDPVSTEAEARSEGLILTGVRHLPPLLL